MRAQPHTAGRTSTRAYPADRASPPTPPRPVEITDAVQTHALVGMREGLTGHSPEHRGQITAGDPTPILLDDALDHDPVVYGRARLDRNPRSRAVQAPSHLPQTL